MPWKITKYHVADLHPPKKANPRRTGHRKSTRSTPIVGMDHTQTTLYDLVAASTNEHTDLLIFFGFQLSRFSSRVRACLYFRSAPTVYWRKDPFFWSSATTNQKEIQNLGRRTSELYPFVVTILTHSFSPPPPSCSRKLVPIHRPIFALDARVPAAAAAFSLSSPSGSTTA